ncbi:MAG: hypothetical protein OXI76_08525 [Gemmatimonadota bacterium]|nr:hypothetical protein [Gemmatimonadota bacterium]
MSDLYNEATRHEYIKVPRYLVFLGGGLVAVLFVAMGLWMTVTTEEPVVDPPETVEEADFRRMAARIAAARAVAPEPGLSERRPIRARLTREIASGRELAEATAAVLTPLLEEDDISVRPQEGEAGFALDVTPPNRDRPTRMILGFANRLELVARGEERFAEMGGRVLDWVPVYPGARNFSSTVPYRGSVLSLAAFLADASDAEIIDWYQDVADLMNEPEADPSLGERGLVETVLMGSDGGIRERFSMAWGDRQVTVVVTEDEFGGSLFVIAYRE